MLRRCMSRTNFTPWRISLNHDFVIWQSLHYLEILLALQTAAVQSNVKAQSDELFRLLQGAIERVNDTATLNLRLVLLDYLQKVIVSGSAVQEQRQIELFRQLELLLKVFLLNVRLTEVKTIVVETNFANSNNFIFMIFDLLSQPIEIIIWTHEKFAATCGMSSNCAV